MCTAKYSKYQKPFVYMQITSQYSTPGPKSPDPLSLNESTLEQHTKTDGEKGPHTPVSLRTVTLPPSLKILPLLLPFPKQHPHTRFSLDPPRHSSTSTSPPASSQLDWSVSQPRPFENPDPINKARLRG